MNVPPVHVQTEEGCVGGVREGGDVGRALFPSSSSSSLFSPLDPSFPSPPLPSFSSSSSPILSSSLPSLPLPPLPPPTPETHVQDTVEPECREAQVISPWEVPLLAAPPLSPRSASPTPPSCLHYSSPMVGEAGIRGALGVPETFPQDILEKRRRNADKKIARRLKEREGLWRALWRRRKKNCSTCGGALRGSRCPDFLCSTEEEVQAEEEESFPLPGEGGGLITRIMNVRGGKRKRREYEVVKTGWDRMFWVGAAAVPPFLRTSFWVEKRRKRDNLPPPPSPSPSTPPPSLSPSADLSPSLFISPSALSLPSLPPSPDSVSDAPCPSPSSQSACSMASGELHESFVNHSDKKKGRGSGLTISALNMGLLETKLGGGSLESWLSGVDVAVIPKTCMPTGKVRTAFHPGKNFSHMEWKRRKMGVHSRAAKQDVRTGGICILIRNSLIPVLHPTWELVGPDLVKLTVRV
uniref:Uncharacterized protein n=1 Tax=Chromera velia CCMP2878 TaxID=1169474 RepID=A0A0G4G9A1_9ALVE|eukprot:Cvel_20827.t1-p1 / transcript=Cvel_20827.t1 / gene=Cvel_20827 / organism=Chromera_velia_CCMP2878 / gene_product=hypothetical protein / transcript_product=hypothetical protein / location=Cvel_scaffold1905:10411-11808(+) / protein_length=466 / sequence_SO=supercontig / SO=protein_coding / is_pseudo=false